MNEAGFSVRQGKNAKSQVGECIKLLQSDSTLPIQRARMRVKVGLNLGEGDVRKKVVEKVLEGAEKVESEDKNETQWEAVCLLLFRCVISAERYFLQVMLIDPGQFRIINDLLQKECKGKGRIETMTFAATGSS